MKPETVIVGRIGRPTNAVVVVEDNAVVVVEDKKVSPFESEPFIIQSTPLMMPKIEIFTESKNYINGKTLPKKKRK